MLHNAKFNHMPPQDLVSVEFFDPLRGLSTEILEPIEDFAVAQKHAASQPTSHLSAKEWASFNKLLMQKFPVPKMISVSAVSLLNITLQTNTHNAKFVNNMCRTV